MKPIIWNDCYDVGWKGFITPGSFAHPAKYARGLIERIFDHCLDRGYLERGDCVGDCFGGIGTGGIIAAYRGLEWQGVELEPKFVGLAEDNFELHHHKLDAMGLPWPRIIQGNSRAFHVLIGETDGMVSSPPYSETLHHGGGPETPRDKLRGGGSLKALKAGYPESAGQIGALKEGTVQGVISSPPYAVISTGAGGLNTKPPKHAGQQSGRNAKAASQDTDQKYGQQPGQIAVLKSGDVHAVVTSPPWESNSEGGRKFSKMGNEQRILACSRGHGASDAAVLAQAARDEQKTYGDSPGQIGQLQSQTYWEAMSLVYQSCFKAIKPGGVLVLVMKDYVKGGKRVPLCDDTVRLIEHVGFVMVERIHAMLVKSTNHADLFGEDTVQTKSRKSFFRRLAEKKGSPAIDFEEVLIARKPL